MLEKGDMASRIAAEDILVAVGIPIHPHWRGARTEFQVLCLLFEK